MKPTLFLLAAGMGSRYGGLKQLDTLGPQGQSIMDYSIYDAIQAGFGKIVWVIRRDFEQQFREQILSKYEGRSLRTLFPESGCITRGLYCSRGTYQALGHQPRCPDGRGGYQRAICRAQL